MSRTSLNDRWRLPLALLGSALLVALLAGCSTLPPADAHDQRKTAHPLTGRIHRLGEQAATSFATLLERMRTSDVVYLGETHDNVAHHHIEQQVVNTLLEAGARPALGFEFFSREQTSHLLRYRNGSKVPGHADGKAAEQLLRAQLGWESNRDADWNRFVPMLRQARTLALPLFGADLPGGLRVNLTRYGYDGLNPVEQLTTTRSPIDDAAYRSLMIEQLREAHCGWGDAQYLGRLYETWLARNEAMAEAIVAMVKANPGEPVVVILGGAHTEYDLGVYGRVAALLPGVKQLNIRLQDIDARGDDVQAYFAPLLHDGRDFGPRHEYLWFTSSPQRREDPCTGFHRSRPSHKATIG